MKTEVVQALTSTFEAHAQQTDTGVEYWLARDLQHLLGYAEWRNFSSTVISKAKTACEVSGHVVADHFVDVNKMVWRGKDQQDWSDLVVHAPPLYIQEIAGATGAVTGGDLEPAAHNICAER